MNDVRFLLWLIVTVAVIGSTYCMRDKLIEAQEDQLFSTINQNPGIYSTTSYHHHRRLLLKATTSGTELITDLYPIVLDISWARTLFRE